MLFRSGPEVGEVRSGPGTVFRRRKGAEIQRKVTAQSKGVAGFKYQMGIAFQGKGIDVEIPYRSRADQGASGPYLDRIGGAEEGLRGGPGNSSGVFPDDGVVIGAVLREVAVRRAVHRPVVGISIDPVSCRSAPDIGGSLGNPGG